MDHTIEVRVCRDGRIAIMQGEQEVLLTAAQVVVLTETFVDLIDRAINDPTLQDPEPGKPGIPKDLSGVN